MLPWAYERAATLAEAMARARDSGVVLLAGGTELIPWMRDQLASPRVLLDIGRLPLDRVEVTGEGDLRIGGLARLSDIAASQDVRRLAPALASAIDQSASPSLRTMATLGGNLLQRTRCPHFRAGPGVPCNRREPGSGCSARVGDHRVAAIVGVSESCIASHPSDPAVALAALDAVAEIESRAGKREIPVEGLYRDPGTTPHLEYHLEPGEVVTAIRIPRTAAASAYIKVRDRASFDFALVSAAVAARGTPGRLEAVTIALGGVAPKPWRCRLAESRLLGEPLSSESVRAAMQAELVLARPMAQNAYKVELAIRVVDRALSTVIGPTVTVA